MSERPPGPILTAGRLLWQNADAVVPINVLWVALTALIVTAPPALAGLYTYMHRLSFSDDAFPTRDDFWQGFHALRGPAWRWALLNGAAVILLASNLLFYRTIDTPAARALTWGWAIASAVWAAVQGYVFPLLLRQEQPRIRTALRNALVLTLHQPGRTLLLALLSGGIVIVSSAAVLPWILFSGAALALLSDQIAERGVRQARERARTPDKPT